MVGGDWKLAERVDGGVNGAIGVFRHWRVKVAGDSGRVPGQRREVVCRVEEAKKHGNLVIDPGLSVNVSHVGLDGARFDIEILSDLFIAEPATDELGDLDLSPGHPIALLEVRPVVGLKEHDVGEAVERLIEASMLLKGIRRW